MKDHLKLKAQHSHNTRFEVVSAQHSDNTRFASRQNLSRPKTQTNYGTQTFKFISLQAWESINSKIKRSNSVSIF